MCAPLLSKRCDKVMVFRRVLDLYLGVFDWKVFCWPKGTSLECTESIYVKTMEAACMSDECLKEDVDKS